MPQVDAEDFYAEIRASTEIIASLVGSCDAALAVPTCPGWTLRHLATHVGRAHRWAAEIAARRSAEFIPFRAVPDGKLPDDPAARPDWLRAGAQRIIDAVSQAETDLVWTFTGPRPASFWGRRMAHETMVHRADAEIAAGGAPRLKATLAADAIDEWLGFQSGRPLDRPDSRPLPEGRVLHIHATDSGLGEAGEWLVRSGAGAVTLSRGHGHGDVVLRGPAAGLLLVLVRRIAPEAGAVEILGDPSLLSLWLEHTPF